MWIFWHPWHPCGGTTKPWLKSALELPVCVRDPKQDSMNDNMEWFHQKWQFFSPRTILGENSWHYVNLFGFTKVIFSQLEIIWLKSSTWSKFRPPLMLYLETVKPESHYFWILCGGVTNYFPMKASTLQNENAFTSMNLVVEY